MERGTAAPLTFRQMSVAAKQLDGSGYHLVRNRPQPRRHCVRWDPAPPSRKGGQRSRHHFLAHACYGQTAGWIRIPLGWEVDLGPGDTVYCVRWGLSQLPHGKENGTAALTFRPMSVVAKWLPISATGELLLSTLQSVDITSLLLSSMSLLPSVEHSPEGPCSA